MVDTLARAILANDLANEVQATESKSSKLRVLGVCAVNCMEWEIVDIACNMHGLVIVPMYGFPVTQRRGALDEPKNTNRSAERN